MASTPPRPDRRTFLAGSLLGTAAAAVPTPTSQPVKTVLRRPPAAAKSNGLGPATPSGAIVTLHRLGFGHRPGELEAFDALAGNDADRLAAWLDMQLDPGSLDETELNAQLAAGQFESYGISSNPDTLLATLWNWYTNGGAPSGNTSSNTPRDELVRATFTRAIYARGQ